MPFSNESHNRDVILQRAAERSHGFTGADLDDWVRRTVLRKISKTNAGAVAVLGASAADVVSSFSLQTTT